MPVVAREAVGAFFGEQRRRRGLAARHARVPGAFPARMAEGTAAGQPHDGVPETAALRALLGDPRIPPVAAAADTAVWSPGDDQHAGGAATAARPVLPRAGIAAAADPPFLAQLPQIGGDLPAVRAAGADDLVPGLVQHAGQPEQHQRAEGASRREGIGMRGHVRSQLFEEPGRALPLHRDRHRGFQRGRGLLRADRGQRRCHPGDSRVHRGFQPGSPRGEPGSCHKPSGLRIDVRRTAGA